MTLFLLGVPAACFVVVILLICRAAAIADREMEESFDVRRIVGYCGSCGGPVVFTPGIGAAVCPCGDTHLPRRFLRAGSEW